MKRPFFYELVDVLAEQFKNIFPELNAQKEILSRVIMEEEIAFLKTLETGIKRLNAVEADLIKMGMKTIPGNTAFELYDTYGFPFDLTELIAKEKELAVDNDGFNAEMVRQKERSRHATATETGDWKIIRDTNTVEFTGYDTLQNEAHIVKMRSVKNKNTEQYQVVLDRTPFYAESGGQIGDTGILKVNGKSIRVTDTKKENDLIIHITDSLPEESTSPVLAIVDVERRRETAGNHTATHLLHAALRNILGTHVQQKGSYVGPDRLRFDFSHFTKVHENEIAEIEQLINRKVRENIPVITRIMRIEEARESGAMMLFGEKYGDTVRVVIADENYSKEFCGGTHARATGDIGFCKIVSEGAVAAGIRRIEAITGTGAEKFFTERIATLKEVQELVKSQGDIVKNIRQIISDNDRLQKEIDKYQRMQMVQVKADLLKNAEKIGSATVIRSIIPLDNPELIKKLAFELRNEVDNLYGVLGADIDGRANLTVIISDGLVKQYSLDASKIVKELGKEIEGGGGGQTFFASAGGKNPAGLQGALNKSLGYLHHSAK